jgi:hypothetical protein
METSLRFWAILVALAGSVLGTLLPRLLLQTSIPRADYLLASILLVLAFVVLALRSN